MNDSASTRLATVRLIQLAVAMLLLLMLVGCAPGAAAMTVSVRDRETGAPVPNALVQLRPLHLFNPTPPNEIVDPFPTSGSSGTTDAGGDVALNGVFDHPMEVLVLASGYMPLKESIVVEQNDDGSPWIVQTAEDVTEDALPQLQIQIRR